MSLKGLKPLGLEFESSLRVGRSARFLRSSDYCFSDTDQ
uniref:Uncharacterized protein n=1 Tax=Anguilla anguilla TaxID=7936 RepID=A0A0E9QVC9_ANGAN